MEDVKQMTREQAVARSRNLEARSNVFRANASRTGNDAYLKRAQEVDKDYQAVSGRIRELDEAAARRQAVDLEGTAPTMSDRSGAYARDAEVARAGGLGITDSNANPKEAQQRAEEASDPEKVQEKAEANQKAEADQQKSGKSGKS